MFAGRPDWHAPTHVAGRPAYAAFEQPGRFMVAPQRMLTASLALDIYEQDRGDAGLENFSLLQLGFEAEYGLEALRQAALEWPVSAVLGPLPAEAAWLRLHAKKKTAIKGTTWRRDFEAIRAQSGFGTPVADDQKRKELKPWPEDVLRHTGISCPYRVHNNEGLTASWAG